MWRALFPADNRNIDYMGRIQFQSGVAAFLDPGVVVRIHFRGPQCRIVLHDQVPDDKVHNYVLVLLGGNLGFTGSSLPDKRIR